MHTFIEVTAQAIKDIPNFYHEDNRYFEINRDGTAIGYIAIRPFNDGCNFGVHMVDRYRLTQSIVKEAFNIPDNLGYSRIYFVSDNKIVTSFLDYMGRFGVFYICNMFGKKYYAKEVKV